MGKRLPNTSINFEVRISIDNEYANTSIMMEIFLVEYIVKVVQ